MDSTGHKIIFNSGYLKGAGLQRGPRDQPDQQTLSVTFVGLRRDSIEPTGPLMETESTKQA